MEADHGHPLALSSVAMPGHPVNSVWEVGAAVFVAALEGNPDTVGPGSFARGGIVVVMQRRFLSCQARLQGSVERVFFAVGAPELGAKDAVLERPLLNEGLAPQVLLGLVSRFERR
mgnify:CR=1 FL=1